ncbi:MAG: hypothetical protein DMF69_04430 [Acidobacteria bacterium]|nr:MAG: hypothetical protein DMF69_04430 [Acidobacteriota bacterium]
MDELIKSLPRVLRAVGNSPELLEPAAIAAWKHTAGEGLRPHAIATKLDGSVLVIVVRDAIWQNQLAQMKRALIHRINSVLGEAFVKNIELRVDPTMFAPSEPIQPPRGELLENEVPIELWSAANAIQDKQLRQKFLKAATALLRRKTT